MDKSSADIRKGRVRFAVILSLLIVALVSDLSWIDIIIDSPLTLFTAWIVFVSPLALFLAVPIIYGWITKNEIWATLLGVFLLLGYQVIVILVVPTPPAPPDIVGFLHFGQLAIVACSAGYFASKRMLPVLIVLAEIWALVFCTGID